MKDLQANTPCTFILCAAPSRTYRTHLTHTALCSLYSARASVGCRVYGIAAWHEVVQQCARLSSHYRMAPSYSTSLHNPWLGPYIATPKLR